MLIFINGIPERIDNGPFEAHNNTADAFWATKTTPKAAFNTVSDLIARKNAATYNARLLDGVNREVENFIYSIIPKPHRR